MKRISRERKIEILKGLRRRTKEGRCGVYGKTRFTCHILDTMLHSEELYSFRNWYMKHGSRYARKESEFCNEIAWFDENALAPRIRVINKLIKDLEKKL